MSEPGTTSPTVLGRYALFDEIASGGMAVVHFGRAVGAAGFSRPVAIKRLHPQYARDPEFGSMFLDEARLAARVQHPNVVSTLDVVALEGELFLVLEYVHGESLAGLLKASRESGDRVPPEIATAVVCGALYGLHAAHDATDNAGTPLNVVHRDVSPHNLLVGVDGIARVLDFGVAKAAVRAQTTREGQLKGKLKYMAPEQLRGESVTRTADVYSAGVVLWEVLTGDRLFAADNEAALFGKVLEGVVAPPSRVLPTLPRALDGPILRALNRDPAARFPTARDMAIALEAALKPASAREVGDWVTRTAGPMLAHRAHAMRRIEAGTPGLGPGSQPRPGPTRSATLTEAAPVPPSVRGPVSAPPSSASQQPASARAPAPSQLTLTAHGGAAASQPPTSMAGDGNSPSTLTTSAREAAVGPLPSAAPRGRASWVLVALGLLTIGAVAFASGAWRRPMVLGQARTGVAGAAALVTTVAAVTTADGVDSSPRADPAAPATASADPVTDEPHAAAADPRPRWRPRPTPSANPAAPTPARPDCDPPYYEDDAGIRRVKRHCLP